MREVILHNPEGVAYMKGPARRHATGSLYPGYAIVAKKLIFADIKGKACGKKAGPRLSLEEEVHKV